MTDNQTSDSWPSKAILAQQVGDLQAVLEVSRELSATTELMLLLQKVENAALKVLSCERATVYLYDRSQEELYSKLATGVEEIRFPADRGIAGEAVRTRRVINVPDAYRDPRFNPEIDQHTGFRTRNMITLPLLGFDGSVVGVLQVLNKCVGSFSEWDNELVRSFGAQVGVALQRQLLLDHYAEKQRIEYDLSIAKEIQQHLLPSSSPQLEGMDIAGWNRPADETGGDCYDFFTLPDGSLTVTVSDATGHGIGPALVMAECRALFRATAIHSPNLGTAIQRINKMLYEDLPMDRFVTAFFGVVTSSRVSWLSAGHGPLIQYHRGTDTITALDADSLPLGMFPELDLPPPHRFDMQPGDIMILVTDGFFEWANKNQEPFGLERIYQVIRDNRDACSAEIIHSLCQEIVAFVGGLAQDDDLTAVIIKKLL